MTPTAGRSIRCLASVAESQLYVHRQIVMTKTILEQKSARTHSFSFLCFKALTFNVARSRRRLNVESSDELDYLKEPQKPGRHHLNICDRHLL